MKTLLHTVAQVSKKFIGAISVLSFLILFPVFNIQAQFTFGHVVPWEVVAGDQMVGGFHVTMDLGPSPLTNGQRYADDCIVVSPRHIYVQGVLGNQKYYDLLRLPDTSDYTITDVMHKTKRDSSEFLTVFLKLSNGSLMSVVIRYPIDSSGLFPYVITKKVTKPADTTQYARIVKYLGDDLYQWDQDLNHNYIYVSRDSGNTWNIDTAGLNGVQVFDIAVDSAQNVWVATANGLYKQALAGNTWSLNACPASYPSLVYADNTGRVWVYGSNQLYYSSDEGSTWHQNSTGLPTTGPVFKLSDDPFGNIYALINNTYSLTYGDKVYKSIGGTGAFTRIDQNLVLLNGQADDSADYAFVVGDSTHIYVGGKLGMQNSTDGGATWQPVDIASESMFGLVRANNGDLIITNNLGCFKRPEADSVCSKLYPQNGYVGSRRIFKDDAGTLYTQGANLGGLYNGVGPYMTVKSADNGITWVADTAGISATTMYVWWVDEAGGQHAGSLYTTPLLLYYKPASGAWAIDTAGLSIDTTHSNYTGAFGSDHNGRVYVAAGSGIIFSRPLTGGTWMPESGINDVVYSFAHTSTHAMVAAGNSDAHYKTGSSWQTMPINAPAPYGGNKIAVAVDDSDNAWVAFAHQGSTGNYVGDGVYYTPDYGNHWFNPGGNIDVVTFRLLVPVGDSVYGITYSNGIFIFNRNGGASGINEVSAPRNMVLFPNPTRNGFQILYSLPQQANEAYAELYDVSGRLLKRVILDTTSGQRVISTSGIAAGVYAVRLMADGRVVATDKVVVQ